MTGTAIKSTPQGSRRSRRPDLRIGELSRRVGVSPGTLRAWERRYGLFDPLRTESGYRLYSAEDEARVRKLTHLCDQGVATAEAARLAREDPHLMGETGHGTVSAEHAAPSQAGARVAGRAASSDEGAGASAPAPLRIPVGPDRVEELAAAFVALDEFEAHAILDEAAAEMTLAAFLEGLVLPFLRDVGSRWQRGEATPAQEHFASNLIRGHLFAMGRGWGSGGGPLAVLACPSGERHDLGLVSFGLLLRERGWRIAYFGQDTPAFTLAGTVDSLAPDAVVVSAVDSRRLRESATDIERIAAKWPLYVGGAGASSRFADRIGATFLEGEPSYGAATLDATAAAAAA